MPNRIVREGILTSARLNAIADNPAVEVGYRRLHSVVDDFGRYSAIPTLLRAACYPLRLDQITDKEILEHLSAMEQAGLIMLYEVNGAPYLEITDFRQTLRTKRSKFPAPAPRLTSTCISHATQESGNFEEFFERCYARHPKKGNRNIAAQYLLEVIGTSVQPEGFEKMHIAWCESDAWKDGGGRFVKTNLAEWIMDKGWRYPPPANKPGKGDLFDMSA